MLLRAAEGHAFEDTGTTVGAPMFPWLSFRLPHGHPCGVTMAPAVGGRHADNVVAALRRANHATRRPWAGVGRRVGRHGYLLSGRAVCPIITPSDAECDEPGAPTTRYAGDAAV